MDGLGGALRELAREAQPGSSPAPGDLWRQGRQRVRRRRAIGAAVAAAAVTVLAFAGSFVPQPTVTMPAGDPHEPAIPKNIHSPNRFLAGTDDEGPLGQIAVLGQTRDDRVFGISATTGEYRFLDLPGRVRHTTVTLSPDGRKVAYWITGTTREQQFSPEDEMDAGGPVVSPVAGPAVYDTVDDSVRRRSVPSDYGLDPDPGRQTNLVWLDHESMIVRFGFRVGSNMTNRFGAYHWSPAGGEWLRLDDGALSDLYALPDGGLDGTADVTDGDGASVVPLDDRLRQIEAGFRLPVGGFADYSRRGARVVVTGWEGNGGIQRVRTGVVGPDSRVDDLTAIGEIVGTRLLGWRSDRSVLVAALPGERYPEDEMVSDPDINEEDRGLGIARSARDETRPDYAVYEVDLLTEDVRRLGTADDLGERISLAQDLLAAPMVPGGAPPSVFEALRVPIGIGILVLVAAAAGWLGVRRRRRAEG